MNTCKSNPFLLLLASCLYSVTSNGVTGNSDNKYECFPNGTIVADNPKPEVYRFAVALDLELSKKANYSIEDKVCQFSWNMDRTKMTIGPSPGGYCTKSREIQVILGETVVNTKYYPPNKDVTVYRIKCAEIPDSGISINVSQEFMPTFEVLLRELPEDLVSILPSFELDVKSEMRPCCDYVNQEPIDTAHIGEHLKWTLEIYHEYYMVPISCVAYPGFEREGSEYAELYTNGCSEDVRLVSYNTTDTVEEKRVYVSDFYVFNFYDSPPIITIDCELQICPPNNPDLCSWNEDCEDSEWRRRRAAEEYEETPVFTANARFMLLVDHDLDLTSGTTPGFSLISVISLLISTVGLFLVAT